MSTKLAVALNTIEVQTEAIADLEQRLEAAEAENVALRLRAGDGMRERLRSIVVELYAYYLRHGYHTFRYWMGSDGSQYLADALDSLLEELYPDEWRAAWEPYDEDKTVLSRDPKPLAPDIGKSM